MTVGDLAEIIFNRPDLYHRELNIEHIPGDVTPEEIRLTESPETGVIYLEA